MGTSRTGRAVGRLPPGQYSLRTAGETPADVFRQCGPERLCLLTTVHLGADLGSGRACLRILMEATLKDVAQLLRHSENGDGVLRLPWF